jgi:hypothetical protein
LIVSDTFLHRKNDRALPKETVAPKEAGTVARPAGVESKSPEPPLPTLSDDVINEAIAAKARRANVDFPLKYDGRPDPKTPPEMVDKIIAVHKRYWENYARLGPVRMKLSLHTSVNGEPLNPISPWDMDADVELDLNHRFSVKGVNAEGKTVDALMDADNYTASHGGNWHSFMQNISDMFYALPEYCRAYSAIKEGLPMEGGQPGVLYDVLICQPASSPGHEHPSSYHWYNRDTGMLDKIETRDQAVKEKFGHYSTVTFTYVRKDGISLATDVVYEGLEDGYKQVEKYTGISLEPRTAR